MSRLFGFVIDYHAYLAHAYDCALAIVRIGGSEVSTPFFANSEPRRETACQNGLHAMGLAWWRAAISHLYFFFFSSAFFLLAACCLMLFSALLLLTGWLASAVPKYLRTTDLVHTLFLNVYASDPNGCSWCGLERVLCWAKSNSLFLPTDLSLSRPAFGHVCVHCGCNKLS